MSELIDSSIELSIGYLFTITDDGYFIRKLMGTRSKHFTNGKIHGTHLVDLSHISRVQLNCHCEELSDKAIPSPKDCIVISHSDGTSHFFKYTYEIQLYSKVYTLPLRLGFSPLPLPSLS